jgi:hypothetical protein
MHAGLDGVPSCSFSEGEPCADLPALVCERSLEGESEQPRESAGMDAGANARRSSIGLARAHHHAGDGFGAAAVSSLDFFAGDSLGGAWLTEVAKNSNAPRAPADPFASLPRWCWLRGGFVATPMRVCRGKHACGM